MTGVIHYPIVTEKADRMLAENKLQVITDVNATKPEIRAAVDDRFGVAVESITTQVTMDGTKKATVTLSEEDDAEDVLARIGVF